MVELRIIRDDLGMILEHSGTWEEAIDRPGRLERKNQFVVQRAMGNAHWWLNSVAYP